MLKWKIKLIVWIDEIYLHNWTRDFIGLYKAGLHTYSWTSILNTAICSSPGLISFSLPKAK